MRRRRRALFQALTDPSTNPARLQKLREKAARPGNDLLRYIAETRVARVQTQEDRKKLWYDLRYNRYAPLFLGQIKPRMKLWAAALHESQLPLARLPEVAVCGRSNSGKSTLINYLCDQYCANMRRAPGSTMELYFWKVGRPAQLCLVDLPGYGFAQAPDEKRLQWTEFTLWYIRARKNLKRVLLLIDGRQGLKPSDREMISYLERHNVAWQIIVTKSDKVPAKQLAKRITIMKEDLTQFRKMASAPIPVAAVKRRGMESLRDILNDMKVAKEVVKDGIRINVYDMLEQRRLRNREKKKRRKARKAEVAEAAAASKATATVQSDEYVADAGDTEASNLHEILGSWSSQKADTEEKSNKDIPWKVHVSTDDRDSQRIDSFMSTLFPDFSDFRSDTAPKSTMKTMSTSSDSNTSSTSSHFDSSHPSHFVTSSEGQANPWPFTDAEESSDDEDMSDIVAVKPEVRRFEIPYHTQAPLQAPSAKLKTTKSSKIEKFPGRISGDASILRRETRPKGDILYTEDDVMSPADYAAGFRRWAPEAPSEAGAFIAEARKRYEREWSMELEDVDFARGGAPDAGSLRKRKESKESQEMFPKMPFITHKGDKEIPKGHAKWTVLGRPPSRILKEKRPMNIVKALGLKHRRGRRRNLGSNLDWDEAKEKWMSWYDKNKSRQWRKIDLADSPKKSDVDAVYDGHQERRKKRLAQMRAEVKHSGGRSRDHTGTQDEAALPEWAYREGN